MVINFRVYDGGKIENMSYDENMIVEDFIKDFLGKYTNYVTLDKKIYLFKINGKILNSKKFLRKPLKEITRDDGIIHFIRKQDTHYSNKIKLIIKI